jgi:hypothetical protein
MSDLQHTLWLWLEGVFLRRISYFLLLKGLIPSVTDILAGKSIKSNLKIIPMYRESAHGWRIQDPDDTSPEGPLIPA